MNPPGSSHTPLSTVGCTLFVKLRHLGPEQTEREVVNTNHAPWYQGMVPVHDPGQDRPFADKALTVSA